MNRTRLSTAILGVLMAAACVSNSAFADEVNEDAAAKEQAASGSAVAEDQGRSKSDQAVDLDAVEVRGYAGSLEKALVTKRNAEIISDGVSAVDIGKFAEANLAESLQRITGVQITRSQGEGQWVSVRGLDPRFVNTMFNGRQLPTASGSRATDFQVFSSDFINQIDIYKTPTADMLESGLAATINVQSIRPLDYGTRKFTTNLEWLYDNQAKDPTPRLSSLYTDTWLDNTLGLAVGVNYGERAVNEQYQSTSGVIPSVTTYNGAPLSFAPYHGIGFTDVLGDNKRKGLIVALQYQPNEKLKLRFDTLYSEFDQENIAYQGHQFYPGVGSPTTSVVLGPDNVALAWSGNSVFGWNFSQYNENRQQVRSSALGAALSLDNWDIDGEVSYGDARRQATAIQLIAAASKNADFSYDTRQDPGGVISTTFNNGYDPNDVNNYNLAGANVYGGYKQPTTDKILNGRADASRNIDWGWVNKIQLGINYSDRTLSSSPNNAMFTGNIQNPGQYFAIHKNPAFFSDYNGSAIFPDSFLSGDMIRLLNDYSLSELAALSPPVPTLASTIQVQEKSQAVYAKLNFSSDDARWSGNAGVRLVRTEEISTGYIPGPDAHIIYRTGSAAVWSDVGFNSQSNSYLSVLPNLNIKLDITDRLLARFGIARVLQRPDLNSLAAASTVGMTTPPTEVGQPWLGTISRGNPELDPYYADQFDMSLEWYFNDRSLLSAAVFYKSVKNYPLTGHAEEIHPVVVEIPPSGGTIPVGTILPGTFAVSLPINSETVKLKGLELSYQQPFSGLPGKFSHLGAMANYSLIYAGDLVVSAGTPALPVPGTSRNSYNLGLYYQGGKFGMHALYNYRSEWVVDSISFFGDGVFIKAYDQLNLSASYNINKYVALSANVINLQNTPYQQVNKYGMSRYYGLTGRQASLGVRVTF